MRIHHIGIVMPSQEQADRYIEKFRFEIDYSEYVPSYSATCIYLKRGEGGSAIELVIPSGGALKAFNRGRGGIHHIAIEVEDIIAAERHFRENNMDFLEENEIKCDSNILINFLQLRFGEGVLIEFVQRRRDK